VLERSDRIGGLLRYGIPDFKMEKWVIDRRMEVMKEEGIVFEPSVNVGVDVTKEDLDRDYDAVVFCGGSTIPRDLPIEGRELDGVVLAMNFLPQQNKRVAGDGEDGVYGPTLNAEGKHIIVIGGGDTGSDCIGTSTRQLAASVTNFELLPEPPKGRPQHQPWPYWPMRYRKSTSHEEASDMANGMRQFSVLTKKFVGDENGKLTNLVTVECDFVTPEGGGRAELKEVEGTEKSWDCDMAILAMGFVGPETNTIIAQYGCDLDERGNVKVNNWMTSADGFFAAGDSQRGQSLIVWAISDGRECARAVDVYLEGKTDLPTKDGYDLPRV
jgi:glutamate synthase (NADPH/NADH) small chain